MIIKGEKYQKDASEQQLYDSLVTAPRGDIYDRNMQKLATSSPAWTVYITPNGIKSLKKESDAEAVRKKIAEGLSEILEMDYNTVYDYTGKKIRDFRGLKATTITSLPALPGALLRRRTPWERICPFPMRRLKMR